MKAIIPVAGAGTQLRPHTYTQPKALIPVAGKPILGFIIDQLQAVGVEEFVFVLGYLGEKIKNYVQEKYPDLKAEFPIQENREGLGHAIWVTKEFVQDGEDALIVLGDTIIEADLQGLVDSADSQLGIKKVDDPRNFGVAELNVAEQIKRVVEKPKFPKSNMALVGIYKIRETRSLFAALDELVNHPERAEGQEVHLTDALQKMIEEGIRFQAFKVDNWYDCGKVEILLETNAKLLKGTSTAMEDLPFFDNTIIIHPVSIAAGTKISNSIIGPNVTIGEDSDISYSIVKHSIIGDYAELNHIILDTSVIGSDAVIKGMSQTLNIGDNTEIDLSGRN